MTRCNLCHRQSQYISKELGVCLRCIRENPEKALPIARQSHIKSRAAYGLPETPPHDPKGISCLNCVNQCQIPENELGYCGLRKNEGGQLTGVSLSQGKLSWYHDPLPTNCVGDWICSGGTGAGFPQYAYRPGPERGYKNLAVFFQACSFNCLYCQNWHFKVETLESNHTSIDTFLSAIDERTSCICYFGGDPSPQLPFSLAASKRALEAEKGRILRICWETNGSMHEGFLDEMIALSLKSGGCVKFDLKAWDENLHIALTGVSNQRTLSNFKQAATFIAQRPVPHLLIASTLLVPGYIDDDEVGNIAEFIASINPYIPYSLLAFHPHFMMSEMPMTTRISAERCFEISKEKGLKNVKIGNIHLLK